MQRLQQCLTCGQGGQHAQSGTGNAEHVGQREADKDADGDDDAGDDGGLVSQSQTKDDVSGSTSSASVSHILHDTVCCLSCVVDEPSRYAVTTMAATAP